MSSFVSDPNVVVKLEYAIVVGRNRFGEMIIFLCSSQSEVTAKIDAEIGNWYLHNGDKLFKRIKPPVPTNVSKSKKGETVVQITVPAIHLESCGNLKLPFESDNVLLSPVLGPIGAMFTPNMTSTFNRPGFYEIKAFWLSDSLSALRKIKQRGLFSWAVDGTSILPIPDKNLGSHPFLRHMPCLRVSIVETLFGLRDSVNYYAAIDLSLPGQPVVVVNSKPIDYGENISVFVLPVHLKNHLMERKILNIAIEAAHDDVQFARRINYEPTGPLAIDYFQQQQSPTLNVLQTNGKVNGNGTAASVNKTLDYKQALISKAPAPVSTTKIGSSSSDKTSSTDGFHLVTSTKKREKVVGQTFDESKYLETLEEPVANKLYQGLIVSKDNKNNFYIYCPTISYEIQLSAATDLPDDLKISEFVEFRCNTLNTTYYYSRPSAEFIKKIPPLFKCGTLKNSVFLHCKLLVPSTFHPQKSPIAFTDFVPKVADKNGLLTLKDVGKKGTCVITRTKNTGHSDIYWLFHKVSF